MKILIFGASGLLGQDLVAAKPSFVELLPAPREADITDPQACAPLFLEFKPAVVINAVGYNDVDGAEKNPSVAHALNAEGPGHLAQLCENHGNARLVHFSTDYVFSGRSKFPYRETDPPSPLGIYATSKRDGEQAVEKIKNHLILRTTSLYGNGRPNFASRVLEALQSGQPVKMASDLICSPTYTGDFAQWVYRLIERWPSPGIYHLRHGGSCSRYDFAKTLCMKKGVIENFPVEKVSLDSLHLPAPRPLRALLLIEKAENILGPLPSWQEGLDHYLESLP